MRSTYIRDGQRTKVVNLISYIVNQKMSNEVNLYLGRTTYKSRKSYILHRKSKNVQ